MDPKNTNSLDPKLKEVYDRVMNTKISPAQPQSAATPPQPAAPTTPPPPAAAPSVTVPPPPLASTGTAPKSAVDYTNLASHYSPPTPAPQPTKPNVVTPSGTTYGVVNTNGTHKVDSKDEKKGSSSKVLLIALGLLVFFLVYTIIWFVVFGVDLPFGFGA